MDRQRGNAITHAGYVNIYRDDLCGCFHASGVFETKQKAVKAAGEGCVATKRVQWRDPIEHRAE